MISEVSKHDQYHDCSRYGREICKISMIVIMLFYAAVVVRVLSEEFIEDHPTGYICQSAIQRLPLLLSYIIDDSPIASTRGEHFPENSFLGKWSSRLLRLGILFITKRRVFIESVIYGLPISNIFDGNPFSFMMVLWKIHLLRALFFHSLLLFSSD